MEIINTYFFITLLIGFYYIYISSDEPKIIIKNDKHNRNNKNNKSDKKIHDFIDDVCYR